MDINQWAPQFKIATALKDIQFEANFRSELQAIGFQTAIVGNQAIKAHVLIVDVQALTESLSDFVERALKANPDIKIIFVAQDDQFEVLIQYREYNGFAIISPDDAHYKEKLHWEIANACEELYFFYQNEELYVDLLNVKSQLEKTLAAKATIQYTRTNTDGSDPERSPGEIRDLKHLMLIRELSQIEDFEQTVNYYLTQSPHARKAFFSFSQIELLFKLTFAQGFPLNAVKDLKYNTDESELRNLMGLKFSIITEKLQKFIFDLFGTENILISPVLFYNHLTGFFVFETATEESAKENEQYYTELVWPAVSIQLEALWSRKRITDLEIKESRTEFFTNKYFRAKLKEEFLRAQRMEHPLSLLRCSIDNYQELLKKLGIPQFQEKLFIFSQILVHSGRPHDSACRVAENEFVVILPYCTRKNAAIRAERLRKAVEAHEAFRGRIDFPLSFGISEFPSLCNSLEDLDAGSSKALKHIQDHGGNKVCIQRAAPSFVPAFDVSAE